MKRTKLFTLLMASSFIALNAYAMEGQGSDRDSEEKYRGSTPIKKELDIFSDALKGSPQDQFHWGQINYEEWQKNGRTESYDEALKMLTNATNQGHENAKELLSDLEYMNLIRANEIDDDIQRVSSGVLLKEEGKEKEKEKTQEDQEAIAAVQSLRNLRPDLALDVEPSFLVGAFAQRLNDYLMDYMRTEGAQRIVNYCLKLIDGYQESVESLRKVFGNLTETLQKIQNFESPELFVERLRGLINVEDINRTIEQLGFLKTIEPTISYQTTNWANALGDTIAKIQTLIAPPQLSYDTATRILSLKGPLIGINDIKAALRTYPRAVSSNAFALHTGFFDVDMTMPGGCLSFIAPCLKVIGARTVNLSGAAGGAGVHGGAGLDGTPGLPGQNGGHFYAKAFVFNGMHQLTINTNGGVGGRGGNGGLGVRGINGTDGYMQFIPAIGRRRGSSVIGNNLRITPIEPTYSVDGSGTDARLVRNGGHRGNMYLVESLGTNAMPGQNGGQGGQGGIGGHLGTAQVDGFPWVHIAHDGVVGAPGKPGAGGLGGVHGKHCKAQVRAVWNHLQLFNHARIISQNLLYYHGCAPNGQPGLGVSLANPQKPPSNPAFNPDTILHAYTNYYESQAENPEVCPFIKVFPNLSWRTPLKEDIENDPQKTVGTLEEIYTIDGEPFRLQNAAGNHRRSFFSALGLNVEEEIKKLRTHADNPDIRKMIANEIVSAAAAPEDLSEEVKGEIGFTHYESQRDRINSVEEILSSNSDEDPHVLSMRRRMETQGEDILMELRRNASTPEAFIAFLDHQIGKKQIMPVLHDVNGEDGGHTNFNSTSIDAVAYINKLGLKIYQSDGMNRLHLVHQYMAEGATKVAYLLHEGIYFKRLVPEGREQSENMDIIPNFE